MRKMIIVIIAIISVLGIVVMCNCPTDAPASGPDEYIRIVRNGETKEWADETVDTDDAGLYLEFKRVGTTGGLLSIRHYYPSPLQNYLNAYLPDPYPDVTGDGDDSNCTVTENTTDANYVTLKIVFDPAIDGYTSIDCRAKKDW